MRNVNWHNDMSILQEDCNMILASPLDGKIHAFIKDTKHMYNIPRKFIYTAIPIYMHLT